MLKYDKKAFDKLIWAKEKPWEIENKFYEKTIKLAKILRFLPWLEFMWIWNSISMNCAKSSSDIDLFIVTTPNSMHINRLIITLICQILWIRKTNKKHAGMFCLSFFCTTKALNFRKIEIKDDVYLYFWMLYLTPIINFNNTFEKFQKENNFNKEESLISNKVYLQLYKQLSWKKRKTWGIIWFLDKIIKDITLKKTIKSKEKLWNPYWIIINNDMLKFHNNDIRKDFSMEFFKYKNK